MRKGTGDGHYKSAYKRLISILFKDTNSFRHGNIVDYRAAYFTVSFIHRDHQIASFVKQWTFPILDKYSLKEY